MLVIHCTDGTSYKIPRANVSRSELRNATLAILTEEGKEEISGMAKVYYFRDDGRTPRSCKHIYGEVPNGSEEIVDCRKTK